MSTTLLILALISDLVLGAVAARRLAHELRRLVADPERKRSG
jgi:hypothetical protein